MLSVSSSCGLLLNYIELAQYPKNANKIGPLVLQLIRHLIGINQQVSRGSNRNINIMMLNLETDMLLTCPFGVIISGQVIINSLGHHRSNLTPFDPCGFLMVFNIDGLNCTVSMIQAHQDLCDLHITFHVTFQCDRRSNMTAPLDYMYVVSYLSPYQLWA